MGYTVIKRGNAYEHSSSHYELGIDQEADLATLPNCAPGSLAFMNDMTKFWIRDTHERWVPIEVSGGGGVGGGATYEQVSKWLSENVSSLTTYPIVNMTTESGYLHPNTFYVWPEVETLAITLAGSPALDHVAEYCFEFKSGDVPTELVVPSTVKWAVHPTIEANKTYQVSILNDVGVILHA